MITSLSLLKSSTQVKEFCWKSNYETVINQKTYITFAYFVQKTSETLSVKVIEPHFERCSLPGCRSGPCTPLPVRSRDSAEEIDSQRVK